MTADPGGPESPDRAATERGTQHLQAAAREMLSAARAFLDAVEEVVEDPERVRELGHAVGAVAQQAARVGRSAMGSQVERWDHRSDDPSEGEEGGPEPLF